MSTIRTSPPRPWTGRIVLFLLVIITLAPFVALIGTALQPSGTVPTGLTIPSPPHFENFVTAFQVAQLPTLMFSSALLVVMVVPAAILLVVMAAYGIVQLRIPGAPFVFLLFLLGLTIPYESLITPLYYLMRDAHLVNTRFAIALPLIALYLPFGVFWMRAHFLGVPKELGEAASIDGAGSWKALRYIHLPVAAPAIASLAVLFSLWTWNQFIIALVMMDDPLKRTVAGALGAFQGEHSTDLVLICAAAVLMMLPTILVFIFLQKLFVSALLQGSVKG
ncbi:carbohydrate ABC transporter permease [Microbacterium pumilum]|uniref:Carbohydrate ABC transporter permease n=1 Tax=Microbacterium pumilum TaxID=344165 RepID=A0ABN2T344_9MICO